ncbi:MAG: metallophosphoesterase [Caldilineaceae bacterium]
MLLFCPWILRAQDEATVPLSDGLGQIYLPLIESAPASEVVHAAAAAQGPLPTDASGRQIYLPLALQNAASAQAATTAQIVDIPIAHSADDAEESASGNVLLTNGDLELVDDNSSRQTVGLRFDAMPMPQGATISNAYIQFTVDEPNTQNTSLLIQGEAVDNSLRFNWYAGNVSNRPRTAASVAWTPAAWSTVGQAGTAQRTPNLAPVLQEIVNRPGWVKGNALTLIVTGSGVRTAMSFDGNAAGAAVLHIEFDTAPPSGAPVIVAVGDIAGCDYDEDEATAQLVDAIPGTVINLGDSVYPDGTAAQFNDCYEPTWGRHKARTRPAVGNHEYHTENASGYFGYFGAAAGDPTKGYYSYDIGDWHVVVLNSECAAAGGCRGTSPQMLWLQADLAAHPSTCTLAYWHHPRFSSSATHGSNPQYDDFWQTLYAAGVDVVLNGHAHVYERFGPQDPAGAADPARGIRQFIVGTGGYGLYAFAAPEPNSEVREANTYGVLKMTLHATAYDWEFVPIAGQTFTDSGSASCVGAGQPPSTSALDIRVNANTDDAEEYPGGYVSLTNGDLELVDDSSGNQTVGIRFAAVNIAQGATIANAYVQFQADETNSQPTTLTIYGHAADNASTFQYSNGDISTRPRTSASASWSPAAWTVVGQAGADQRTVNIAPIIQEIVNRPGWQSGNALALIITGSGVRTAESFEGEPNGAPLLHVDLNETPTGGGTSGQVDVRVNDGFDDVEETHSGNLAMTSSDLELVDDNGDVQTVGVRFGGVNVPSGATITNAYIQFQVDETSAAAASIVINAHDVDDAPQFMALKWDVSARPRTAATVNWTPAPWNVVGEAGEDQRTANLVAVVQELVDRPGWKSGNAMAFVFTGSGVRTAEAYEGVPSAAPLLHIEFTAP